MGQYQNSRSHVSLQTLINVSLSRLLNGAHHLGVPQEELYRPSETASGDGGPGRAPWRLQLYGCCAKFVITMRRDIQEAF